MLMISATDGCMQNPRSQLHTGETMDLLDETPVRQMLPTLPEVFASNPPENPLRSEESPAIR